MSRPMRVLSLMGQATNDSIEAHFAQYDRVIGEHSGFGPDVIVYPENATSYGIDRKSIAELAEAPDGPSMSYYAETARRNNAWVVGCCTALPNRLAHASLSC